MLNKKKILACVCTSALALSLSVPAFAADMNNPTKTEFTGAVASSLTVSVSVKAPTPAKLYVNPYGMSYSPADIELKAGATLAAGDTVIKETPTSKGFFSDTALIQNNSESTFGVKVTLQSTAPTGSTAVVAASAPASPAANTLVGNFEIADATASTDAGIVTVTPDWTGAKTVAIPNTGASAGTAGAATTTDTTYTLKAATVSTDSMSGTTTTTPSYAAFRLTGDAYVGNGGTWAEDDLVDVTVAFTFTPPAATP